MSSPTDPGADYRAAKAELPKILRRMADAELAAHRAGVSTKDDPEVTRLNADAEWCRALIVACGEVVKGVPFAELIEEGA